MTNRALFLILIGGVIIASPEANAAPHRTEIYFYSSPHELPDGSMIASPLTITAADITTNFPAIDEMDGVVLELAWSQLCPARDACDFSIIDEVLRYWSERHKQVVLGVSNAGPPTKAVEDGADVRVPETPSWVLAAVASYPGPSHQIGKVGPSDVVEIAYPKYWDERFVSLWLEFIHTLGQRYNGNTGLSYIRISTGLVGEDAPTPFGTRPEKAPGYDYGRWLTYSHRVMEAYREAFPDMTLEFDISFIPWGYATADQKLRLATDEFLAALDHNRVFVAFNGFQPDMLTWMRHSSSQDFPLNRLMSYLLSRREKGLPMGLEAVGPMMVPKMQDIPTLTEVVKTLRPDRLVLFGSDAGGVDYLRHGPRPGNSTTARYMAGRPQGFVELGQLLASLLSAID